VTSTIASSLVVFWTTNQVVSLLSWSRSSRGRWTFLDPRLNPFEADARPPRMWLFTVESFAAPSFPSITMEAASPPPWSRSVFAPPAGTVMSSGAVAGVPSGLMRWTVALASAVSLFRTWTPVVIPGRWATGTNEVAPSAGGGSPADHGGGTSQPPPWSSTLVPSCPQVAPIPSAVAYTFDPTGKLWL
jgi:hypothetical protein